MKGLYRILFFVLLSFTILCEGYAGSNDTTQVTVLLSKAALTDKPDSAILYTEKAIELSNKFTYAQGLLRSNLAMAKLLIENKKRSEARAYLLAAHSAAVELMQVPAQLNILLDLGNQSYRIGDYPDAENYYTHVLHILKVNNIKDEQSVKAYTNLGMTYTKLTDYSRAFDALTRSNQLADSLHLRANMGGNFIDIATLFALQKKFQESLQYFEKAVEIFREEKDTIMVGYAQLGMGDTYMQMGNFKQAITFLLSIEKSLVQTNSQFTLYQNLGICSRSIGELTKADFYFSKAQNLNDRLINNPHYSLKNNLERAKLLRQQGQFAKAIPLALQAEQQAKEQMVLLNYKDCLQLLSSLYETSGDTKRALQYQKRFTITQDSISRIDESKRLAEAETRFRLGEKNRELSLLEKENELQKVREQTDRLIMVMLVGSLVVLLVAAGFTARAYKRSQTKNVLLANQKGEIEKANLLITEQSKKLQEADKMKSRFFANISHELRTPVTLLTGMLEFMAEGNNSPKEKERISIALGNSRKLNTIVGEMLELTRLEANKVVLRKRTMMLHPLLNRITGAFGSLLEKKQLRLVTDFTAPYATSVDVDEDRFEKIINNLIYNAIKFTPAGGWIQVHTKLNSGDTVDIRISDSGAGILQGDILHIFDRFYQSQSGAQQHDQQGTGIGLSLVKEFTELHGGTVSVANDIGAVFTLTFTTAQLNEVQTDLVMEDVTFAWKKFDKIPTVLLVEDHEEMRAYVRELLDDACIIAEASDGEEALHWLSDNKTDLIVSDVMMTNMDGYTFLAHLKNSDALRHIPVIMLTARAADEDKLHGLSLGVDDYLVKPFNATELKIRVQNVLLNQASRREWLLKPAQPDEQIISTTADDTFMEAVVAYVEKHIEQPLIAVGDLASHLALSERQLYRKAGELAGLPPAQLIKEIRLKKAYQYLMDKKVNKVAELASRVGYESAAYFSKQFMERFGKRPTEFL